MPPLSVGAPLPLGASVVPGGVNFALISGRASRVELCLYHPASGELMQRLDLPGRSGDTWHGFVPAPLAQAGTAYSYQVHGPESPQPGDRFDAQGALLDPYARALTRQAPLRGIVTDAHFDWAGDKAPAIAWRDTLIYELHVKGFTAQHPQVPQAWRGKFLALTVDAVIDHLKSLGITAVELLPCQAFVSESFLLRKGLSNYWGYNPAAWFAPANEFAVADAIVEFRTMVKALHAAGIEVILDVVFNHTAEGDETGPTLNFRGIDNARYYRLCGDDARRYENVTGCGNTVRCADPMVRSLIIDCLRYWREQMHVDGFRFDLATVLGRDDGGFSERAELFAAMRAEPALARAKLIAEPWDVGVGGYQLGRFPAGWSEWNDKYRDAVRAFWRADASKVGEFAERLAGSSDMFHHDARAPTASINLVTAHDGLTLSDLVSYNERHNEANLEQNADGTGNNLSWNCGVEGPTDNAAVNSLRTRQMKNLLATMFFSQGVPMLQAGDEFARTQRGNNNAYCQDNEISWVDWRLREANADLLRFVERLAQLRRRYAEFRRDEFLQGALRPGDEMKDVTWLHPQGWEMNEADWRDAALRTLGMWYGRAPESQTRLLLLFNAAAEPQDFTLPPRAPGQSWTCLIDTGRNDSGFPGGDACYRLRERSLVLLEG